MKSRWYLKSPEKYSWREKKFAWLRAHFAIIFSLVGLVYIGIDSLNGIFQYLPWYGFVLVVGGVIFLLNRNGKFLLANIIASSIGHLIIFVFADSDSPLSGVFFYFLCGALINLILFSDFPKVVAIGLSLVPILLGILAYTFDFHLLPNPPYSEEIIRVNFVFNFSIATIVAILILQFLLSGNSRAEKSLEESQDFLKATTQQLMQSQERYSLAIKGNQAGVFEWDPATNVMFVSDTWKMLLGYGAEELPTMNRDLYMAMVHPENRECLTKEVEEILQVRKPYRHEIRLQCKDGTYRWFSESGISRVNDFGVLDKVVGSVIDIHDRKLAEETILIKNSQLARMNEELDRFVYSASHDLRAPLSSLLGLVHLLELTEITDEQKLYVQHMRQRVKTMEGFIKEVTDYSRNARTELNREPVPLHNLVQEIFQLHAPASEPQIRLLNQVDPRLVIVTDPVRLKIVLSNLIGNALKYHQKEGTERFVSFDAGPSWEGGYWLTITDNGIGIDPQHHSKIFDMFYRATAEGEGSGLGLYIVKETLTKLGGKIELESTLGGGSKFRVLLPDQVRTAGVSPAQ